MSDPVIQRTSKRSPKDLTIEFAADALIFREEDLATEMYIILEGQVDIFKVVDGEETHIALLERGDFFGEMSLLEGLPRTASARARGPSVKLLRIDGTTFDQMLRDNPEIAVRMMRKLSRRLRETDQQLRKALGKGAVHESTPEGRPEEQQVPRGSARLIHQPTNTEFFLVDAGETTIGRQDPVTGIYPEIDLSQVDVQRSVSRQHAKIAHRDDDSYVIWEEIGTMNGTSRNGERLDRGVVTAIEPGDDLQFGLVTLRFVTE